MEDAYKITSDNADNVSIQEDALRRMQKARAELLFAHPFFGSLALKLKLKVDNNCPNLWTDGKTLAYNPHFIAVLSHDHIMACQAHELLHIACNHHIRRNGRDENLWNKACDYAIGSLLLEAGFSLPDSMLKYDKAYDNKSVDEIYICLSKLEDQDVHGGAQSALTAEKTDKIDDASSGDGNNAQGEGTEVENKLQKASTDGQAGHDEKTKSGSSSSSEEQSQGKDSSSLDFFGEIKDHPLLDKNNDKDRQRAEEEALIQITQAIHNAQGHGYVPLGLLRLYHARIRPSLDWQVLLQRFLESCNDGDYSWSMPNRRYISQDIYLPSRKEPRIPIIALAIDASNSIDNALLGVFCAELENILESYDTSLFVMYHDVAVHKHAYYTRMDRPLRLDVQGGGGTSYKHIPNYIEQENIQPACLLWFTDLECTVFPDEPSYPVLWLATKQLQKEPPFGEVIQLNYDNHKDLIK